MNKVILIVDDSASIRDMLEFTLERQGYNVLKGVDGQDALKYFDGRRIDLLITDLHMPNKNGMELIAEVRKKEDYSYMPILFLTTESGVAIKKEAREKGATGWLTKPFDSERLLHLIKKVLR